MISIVKGVQNNVIVTVTELTTITNPTYLFAFYREENKDVQTCISENISPYPERYDQFVISEGCPGNGQDATVCLSLPGVAWYYTIYAQTSTTNLDPDLADEIVEQGKVFVTGETTPTPIYNYTRTLPIYNPNANN